MTSVERARKFIQAKGKAIALTIVPLATLAVASTHPAKADTLTFGSGSCSVSAVNAVQGGFAGSNSCTDSLITGSQNGISNALKMTGNATVVPFASQGLEGFDSSQILPMGIQFQMTGSATGSDSAVIPLNWDFNLLASNTAVTSGTYTVTFAFSGGGAPASKVETGNLVYSSCGNSVCASTVGSDSIVFDGQITSYSVTLVATALSQSGFLTLNVPQNSIDVNGQVSGAPEPGSMALGATGLLGLLFARFRRRRV